MVMGCFKLEYSASLVHFSISQMGNEVYNNGPTQMEYSLYFFGKLNGP